jgi:DNA replication protein DnaC
MGIEIHNRDGYSFAVVSIEERLRWQGVPKRYLTVEWDVSAPSMLTGVWDARPVTDAGVRKEIRWLAKWSKGSIERTVVLRGPQGRGKTTYAAATFRRAILAEPKPRWVKWPELIAEVADSWTDRNTGERNVLHPYTRAGFLVIDDFGKEVTGDLNAKLRDWQRRIAFELINGRYERQLPTLITTELGAEEMASRLDRAITSRLLHEGRWIHLEHQPDLRLIGMPEPTASEEAW